MSQLTIFSLSASWLSLDKTDCPSNLKVRRTRTRFSTYGPSSWSVIVRNRRICARPSMANTRIADTADEMACSTIDLQSRQCHRWVGGNFLSLVNKLTILLVIFKLPGTIVVEFYIAEFPKETCQLHCQTLHCPLHWHWTSASGDYHKNVRRWIYFYTGWLDVHPKVYG